MKKILSTALLFAGFLGMTSCDSFLDEEPKSAITGVSYYKTGDQIIANVNSMYRTGAPNFMANMTGAYRGSSLSAQEMLVGYFMNDFEGQEVDFAFARNLTRQENTHLTCTNQSNNTWKDAYIIINRANGVLKYIDEIEMNDKAQYKGEAQFYRALNYFYLVKFFGGVPLLTEPRTYLMQYENPWGMKNSSLLTMYASASEDHECPLVLDSDTPSCGDSRFGCWICTLVDKDKSMTAMIQNDEEKEWMFPLLELRDQLDFRGDEKRAREAERRDFRRMDGAVHYNRFSDGVIPGPYTQKARCEFLELVLKAQRWISEHAPAEVAHYKIITTEELREIRRIWVVEKHEFEDLLPAIYKKVFGVPFDDSAQYNTLLFSQEDLDDLRSLCADDIQYQTIRELLDVERKYKTSQRRAGLFENLEHAIKKGFFSDIEEAKNSVRERHEKKSKIEQMRAAENIDDDLTNFLTAMINGENYDN